MKIAVLISGTGTNLQALIDSTKIEGCPYTIGAVIADSYNKASKGISRAREAKIPTYVVEYKGYAAKESAENQITNLLKTHNVELVVLAGYMRLLSPEFVNKWKGKVINLHPSLLPSFPGLDAIKQAYEYGVKVTGVTVHYVDEGMDTGSIVDQQECKIEENWTLEDLEGNIHSIEHVLLPAVVTQIAINNIDK